MSTTDSKMGRVKLTTVQIPVLHFLEYFNVPVRCLQMHDIPQPVLPNINDINCDVTDPTPQTYVVDIIVLVLQAVDTTDLISVL